MHKFYNLLLALVCLSTADLLSQCNSLSPCITERTEGSSLIVEGIVVDQEAFSDPQTQFIYTRHYIQPTKLLKGQTESALLELVTLGGVLEDQAMQVSGALELQEGASGIFMLDTYRGSHIAGTRSNSNIYRPVAGKAGFISYRPDGEQAYDGNKLYNHRQEVYGIFERLTGKAYHEVGDISFPSEDRSSMMIQDIFPTVANAGASDTVYISGVGFGEVPGTLFFANADNGGQGYTSTFPWHIASWSDSLIQVQVPHKAGTGGLIVLGSAGIAFSQENVEVQFAHTNLVSSGNFFQPQLIDDGDDEDGGYRFSLSHNNDNNGTPVAEVEGALEALVRAASAWQDSVAAPIYIGADCPTTDLQQPSGSDDGVNLITFDSDAWDLDVEVSPYALAVTISRYARCEDSEWEVADIDIIIRRDGEGINWYFGEAAYPADNELDFQSVMVHELGHALQLQHVVDEQAVMHYSTTFGRVSRHLGTEDDIAGANYVLEHSTNYEAPQLNCWPTEHFQADRQLSLYDTTMTCGYVAPAPDTTEITELVSPIEGGELVGANLGVYPNPVFHGGSINIELNAPEEGGAVVQVYGTDGRLHRTTNQWLVKGHNRWEEQLSDLLPGVYVLNIVHGGERRTTKLILQ